MINNSSRLNFIYFSLISDGLTNNNFTMDQLLYVALVQLNEGRELSSSIRKCLPDGLTVNSDLTPKFISLICNVVSI